MVVNERPLKKARTDLKDFLSFPGCSGEFSGPFRWNIRSFLSKYGQKPQISSSLFQNILVWKILFRVGGSESDSEIVTLEIVEEDVTSPGSRSVYCDDCRVIGWSGHPVCRKRYHFIIPRNNGYQKPCRNCGSLLRISGDSRCMSCNSELSALDVLEWVHLQLEDTTHLLHGVVHLNGYGHLRRVNGKEGGSPLLSGSDIMDFWDRLCGALGARKISVMDVSKKYGMEFRLLHAVTNGNTWYGGWGFEFGAGSFALTVDAYQKAVDFLSKIPLSHFFQARKPRTHLQHVIAFYQALSDNTLLTVRDLFCFLMGLICKSSQVASESRNGVSCSLVLSTWTVKDIERVQQCMIKVLKVAGGNSWVSWLALKGAAFRLGTSEQLDYCLKVLDRMVLDDARMVVSRCNPESYAIEYSLVSSNNTSRPNGTSFPNKDNILCDIKYLYDALLNPHTMLSDSPKATRDKATFSATTLLDCKQFVKDYECGKLVADTDNFPLSYACQVQLIDQPVDYTLPPPELVFLPLKATIADLKTEATKAFQDVYLLFQRFEVEELCDYNGIEESTQLKCLFGSSGSVTLRGRFLLLQGIEHFRMERGVEIWTVSCICGAKDDDGERMLACDRCGIWQHTRCVNINDLDPVPERFLCSTCRRVKQSTKQYRACSKLKPKSTPKSKPLTIPKTDPHHFQTVECKDELPRHLKLIDCSQSASPTESGTSVISNCMEECVDIVPVNIDSCYLDACCTKLESPNRSGTTSDGTSAVVDTCSSIGTDQKQTPNCYNYINNDAVMECITQDGYISPFCTHHPVV